MEETSRIIVALDHDDPSSALAFARRVKPQVCRLKVGSVLFTTAGPDFVSQLIALGFDIFLDLKFHDIPNTVAQACRQAAQLGVWMLNVHALGGRHMMQAAREAIDTVSVSRPLLIAVTILTSLHSEALSEVGLPPLTTQVERLARLTASCGLDGVVCSAQEAKMLKQTCGEEFKLITPGIRLVDPFHQIESLPLEAPVHLDDQHRIMTPQAAIQSGADYLVIGRPIIQSKNPVATLLALNAEIRKVLDSQVNPD